MNKVFLILALLPPCLWADEIAISLTPQEQPDQSQIYQVHRIVIDPAHGGEDLGAVSDDEKVVEKDVNLAVAKKIADLLKQDKDLEVLMTRKGDDEVSTKARVDLANSHKADLFVSIHCDQSDSDSENGSSSYVYSRKSNIGPKKVIGIKDIIDDLQQRNRKIRSYYLAEHIDQRIRERLKQRIRRIQQAPFGVLNQVDMPSVYINMAFISNPDEAKKLGDPHWRDEMAKAIADGILAYRDRVKESLEDKQATPTGTEVEIPVGSEK